MTIFLLFALGLFICSIINSYLYAFSSPKMYSLLCSLLTAPVSPPPSSSPPPPPPPNVASAESMEEEEAVAEEDMDHDQKLKSVFATFDRDGDGYIAMDELEGSLKRLGISVAIDEVRSMMAGFDANGDGLMDLEEFGMLYADVLHGGGSKRRMSSSRGTEYEDGDDDEAELKEAFDVFDGDGDGVITAAELEKVMVSLGLKQSGGGGREATAEEMIGKVDLDGDGMVNFDEFKKMMVDGGR